MRKNNAEVEESVCMSVINNSGDNLFAEFIDAKECAQWRDALLSIKEQITKQSHAPRRSHTIDESRLSYTHRTSMTPQQFTPQRAPQRRGRSRAMVAAPPNLSSSTQRLRKVAYNS